MKAAGITKPITFHSSRHSFATMMLTLDVDLYTVSKLLGHTKVETTQIYAKIINKKKDDAVSLIDAAFDKMQDSTQSKAI
jgi:site-specific recombinase XerD